MDRPPFAGSVKRARERAQAGLPRVQISPPATARFATGEEGADSPTDVSDRRQIIEPPTSRIPRQQPRAALQNKDGGIGVAISRPTQIPQWPLLGPIASPNINNPDAGSYRPPPGRGPPPQRPPRPSRVPSILDSSRVQDHTPVFQYTPQLERESVVSQDAASTPLTPSSRHTQSSLSSVGSIPDFPLPAVMPPVAVPAPLLVQPRRSVTLGPPPSSRRGDSSFYSNASFVSPIPEESPRSRSHTSFASSAAMPESWGSESPRSNTAYSDHHYEVEGNRFDGDHHYDDAYSSEDDNSAASRPGGGSPYGDVGDESKLVRSASLGKMSKPSIVMHRAPQGGDEVSREPRYLEQAQRPGPGPMNLPVSPFSGGTGYYEGSSSYATDPTVASTANTNTPSLTVDAMLNAYAGSGVTAAGDVGKPVPPPQPYSRLSAIRRPPKLGLDLHPVRDMESRGSMTSLPELIKRATRLAAMIDRGRRPASRFDMDDGKWPDEKAFGREEEQPQSSAMSSLDKHQSGLSDMLAAFPPPAATTPHPPSRASWFRPATSWPLPPSSRSNSPPPAVPRIMTARASPLGRPASSHGGDELAAPGRPSRKCCGLPLWVVFVIFILTLGLIVAAIVVPLDFFVFRRNRSSPPPPEPALNECRNKLKCENGGTNVISRGVCSCICTNGFTGQTCGVAGATGCSVVTVTGNSTATTLNNVTVGQAIPRLLKQSRTNFSIPLDGTDILAKLNTGGLSCIAQNSLLTFDGRSSRLGTPIPAGTEVVPKVAAGDVILVGGGGDASGPVSNPSPDIVGGFTTLTGPFRNPPAVPTTSSSLPTPPSMPSPTAPPMLPSPMPPPEPPVPPSILPPSPTAESMTPTVPTPTPQGPLVPAIPAPSPPPADPKFTPTEETFDFARVSVLLILERQSLMAATAAQSTLQRFFTAAQQGSRQRVGGVTPKQALNVTLEGGNSVDLVNFLITIPGGI